jgi:hypothetical protein
MKKEARERRARKETVTRKSFINTSKNFNEINSINNKLSL